MQQLSFFSFDNESIENKKAPKKSKVNLSVNKKIIDIKTKDYKVNSKVKAPKFDFESTMNQVNKLHEISLKNSRQDIHFFKSDLELGRLLTDLFLHKPYIYKDEKKVIFWEYLDIDYDSSYGYMQSFHIYNLLKINGFKLLPNDREHIYLIEDYSDSQIIEIWEHLTINYKKVTEKNILETIKSLEKTKELQTLKSFDINYSYTKYQSNVFQENSFNMFQHYQDEIKSKDNKISELEKENKKLNIDVIELYNCSLSKFLSFDKKKILLDILILKSDYTEQELKESYKKLSKIFHPDKNLNESEERKKVFQHQFTLISNAYNFLAR